MPGGNDAAFRGFIHDFLAFGACVNGVRAGFGARIGLSGIAYSTLVCIAFLQGNEGVGLSRVAAQLHLSGAFVTIEVAKLVKAGLVEKRVNAADRRRVLLTASAKGRDILKGLAPVQAKVNDALFECLTADEFQALRGMISKLVDCGDKALLLLEMLGHENAATKDAVRRPAAVNPDNPEKSKVARRDGTASGGRKRVRATTMPRPA